jgi:hypothetical protein
MLIVDLTTPLDTITAYFKQYAGTLPVEVSEKLGSSALIELAEKHCKQPYSNVLYQIMANHCNANEKLLIYILKLSHTDPGVVSAVVNSGKAPSGFLKSLLLVCPKSLELDVQLALLLNTLNSTGSLEFDLILKEFKNDKDFSVQARYLIACHEKTPEAILLELSKDKFDYVANAAIDNLEKKEMI